MWKPNRHHGLDDEVRFNDKLKHEGICIVWIINIFMLKIFKVYIFYDVQCMKRALMQFADNAGPE